ncbi:hypothetical protein PENTCL1PPCAC_12244 [Pristionchus entomophagus]|uniref:W02B3.4-like N-terminal domain-containing protein n=1 Tax=Pristionchus entomophagus TaxID=358040 RepID=A0AAV5TBK0_9BILA|nr:hypothetical protein PENTCL1PPCAC_12244 [Pristionchus entomophagus]
MNSPRNPTLIFILLLLSACSYLHFQSFSSEILQDSMVPLKQLPFNSSFSLIPCFGFLHSLPPLNSSSENLTDIFLIDPAAIRKLLKNCRISLSLPLSVMIPKQKAEIDINVYNVTFFTDKGDYLQLNSQPERVLLKQDYQRIGPLLVPVDLQKFLEFYDRSRFIPCLNLDMRRTDTGRRLPENFENKLALVRDALIVFGAFPFLHGGTLLGWYRECSIIPHTFDGDFAVLRREYRPQMHDHLKSQSGFRLSRRLGREYDSLEFTVKTGFRTGAPIDIFILYDQDDNRVYSHGLHTATGRRVKYIYPRARGFCSGILGGKLFFVPCNAEETIAADYGTQWAKDHPTSSYNWMKSGANVVDNGVFTKEEMKMLVYESNL